MRPGDHEPGALAESRLGCIPHGPLEDVAKLDANLLAPDALEAGVQPLVVTRRLGQANLALVMNTYGHATERMQKDATATLESVLSS
jgi:hypothetical protein